MQISDVDEDVLTRLQEPGNTPPVEMLPFLHYIPQRLLGNWKTRAKHVGKEMNNLYNDMLKLIRQRRETKGRMNSFMDRILDQEEKLDFDDHQLYFLGGTMMEGASDTSASIILAGISAFVKWPEVQKKAQAQIDSVIGEDRSPTWEDYSRLPYVAQTVKVRTMKLSRTGRKLTFHSGSHAMETSDAVGISSLPRRR